MAPNRKGTKRKSESPPAPEEDVKKYKTRASSRNKSVSYQEKVSSSEAEEVPQKAERKDDSNFEVDNSSSSSVEEKVSEEVDSSSDENSKKRSSPYFTSAPTARKRRNAAATKNGKVSQVKKNSVKFAVATMSQNQVFKPVNLDKVDIQAEVNLSGSDSDDKPSSSDDDDFQKPKKKSISKPKTETEKVDEENADEKALSEQQENTALDPWSSNLEALNNCQPKVSTSNEVTEEAPTSSSVIKSKGVSSRQPKTSKNKKEKKKPSSSKLVVKADGERLPSNVAELLKAEKNDQELSSEDDENWEKVVANKDSSSPNREGEDYQLPAEGVEIVLAGGQNFGRKRKGPDIQNLIRLKINRIRREIQLVLLFIQFYIFFLLY